MKNQIRFSFLLSMCLYALTFTPLNADDFFPYNSAMDSSPIYSGTLTAGLIYHQNGCLAWNGNLQTPYYSEDHAFRHLNGSRAWGGIHQEEQTFYTDRAAFFHDNGTRAWAGNTSGTLVSSEKYAFYYNNGSRAWGGRIASDLLFHSSESHFYHTNGVLAWRGEFYADTYSTENAAIYHHNGQLAWSGELKSPVYNQHGIVINGAADFVNLNLGNGSWLHINAKAKHFTLNLYMGAGYYLQIGKNRAFLNCCGVSLNIDNFRY